MKIQGALVQQSYAVTPDFLTEAETAILRAELLALRHSEQFREAKIGRGEGAKRDVNRRGDLIVWFDPAALLPAQKLLWAKLEVLKGVVNESLFLGLWALEGHYAIYPEGTFYERHLDRFKNAKDGNLRTLSVVLYLNENWKPGQGGELVLYPEGQDAITVEPRGGTLVTFLSDAIPHEVKPTAAERLSFAGWFTTRSASDL